MAQNRQNRKQIGKVFNDPIHGHIEMHPLLVRIIDTPQFQRLRNIKQLGAGYFVYPGASHNRFEHSLGVAHLAGRLVKQLREHQQDTERDTERDINDTDELCVQIAGLCHDLGHGPFSHVFDGKFMPEAKALWEKKHEDISLEMFDYLIKHKPSEGKKTIEDVMREDYGFKDEDFTFIKEMIQPFESMGCGRNGWPFKGRGEKKAYLYDIVSNKINGIDVDKMDYFARDSYYLGMRSSFDHERFIMFARVCEVGGRLQICQRDKEVRNMYDLFYTRSLLHNRAYQHKVVKIIETMIKDALLAADGKGGIKIAETVINRDMEAYTKLTDIILYQIMNSPHEELQEAQRILRKIEYRQLYHCLLDEKIKPCQLKNRHEKTAERDALVEQIKLELPGTDIKKEDFEINVITVDYGMKEEDPIEKCNFYRKPNDSTAKEASTASGATPEHEAQYETKTITKDEVSDLLPVMFYEKRVHVYYKGSSENCQNIKNAIQVLKNWVKAKKEHTTGCNPTDQVTVICGRNEA
ncbi:deoxynucleoside triphosphate triphosphohydrolase SAMHD1-like [Megalops cyprinoides]|uniref:deoxynucleoside triphosphate triphosphohydrolase SAMHD1-like n=1 Tax=Megalops cyprinoides TaxID=118141 RepID=UPI0018655F38|nr:deoxynucleoside triphosphate triphosphohydrolase SAMHD1-like [Megalops cyprinoides]